MFHVEHIASIVTRWIFGTSAFSGEDLLVAGPTVRKIRDMFHVEHSVVCRACARSFFGFICAWSHFVPRKVTCWIG